MRIYRLSAEDQGNWLEGHFPERYEWQGWGNVTSEDRKELVDWLKKYAERIKNWYIPELAIPKVKLIERIIKEIETSTSIVGAAKLLARLSMEDRLSLNESIPVSSGAYTAFGAIIDASFRYVKPMKTRVPDIKLEKGAINTQTKDGEIIPATVDIYGLEDGKPKMSINGYYAWDLSAYENKDEMFLDIGQGYKVIGLRKLLPIVKQKIAEWNREHDFEVL